MNAYLRLRSVPPPALRNSATWLERLFDDDSEAVRRRVARHREEALDRRCLDQERIYAGPPPRRTEGRPPAQVVLGGRPVPRPDPHKPPLLVLTAGPPGPVTACRGWPSSRSCGAATGSCGCSAC
ncbi:hypothetical protein [Streptomyces sp. NPDC001348]